jgi:5-methylcytosine-specific restriction endonuclease McrA
LLSATSHARCSPSWGFPLQGFRSGVFAHGHIKVQVPDTVLTNMNALILRLEATGQPLRWIGWKEAVILDTKGHIAWTAGDMEFTFRGGLSRRTGTRSSVTVSSIIAVSGHGRHHTSKPAVPPLSNQELFLRDGNTCMYCGNQFSPAMLTRDHLTPLSKGGRDIWQNVVAACRACNHAKGARTPDEARMQLLAVPYTPNRAEYLVLSNRKILADQMAFLRKRFSSGSRLALD